LCSCSVCLFSISCILCFCIVSPFVYSCSFLICVPIYRPLPPGGNSTAVNKYHISWLDEDLIASQEWFCSKKLPNTQVCSVPPPRRTKHNDLSWQWNAHDSWRPVGFLYINHKQSDYENNYTTWKCCGILLRNAHKTQVSTMVLLQRYGIDCKVTCNLTIISCVNNVTVRS